MGEICFGYRGGRCTILTTTNCRGCSFRATAEERMSRQLDAEESLKNRGLKPCIKIKDGVQIMSVRKI